MTDRDGLAASERRVVMLVWNPCRDDSRVIKEAETLSAAGYEVFVLCQADPAPETETRNGVTYQRLPIVRVADLVGRRLSQLVTRAWSDQQVSPSLVLRLLAFGRVSATFRQTAMAMRPTVVHAHDLSTLSTGAKVAKRVGARLVYDTHELALHVVRRPPRIKQWYDAVVQRRYIRVADHVITVSSSIADYLARQYGIARPSVIYNSPPVGKERFSRRLRDDLGLPREAPLAVYLGAVGPHRGVDLCVQALEALPELHLAVVGPRRPALEEPLRSMALEQGSAARLHFLDPVPVAAIAEYLSEADVGVVPTQDACLNHSFCMPNKLFESVLAGLPVVVSDLVELRRFVEQERVGVVVAAPTPTGFAEALSSVIEKPADFFPDGRLEQLRLRYGWEAQGRRLVDIYRGLFREGLHGPGAGPARR